MNRLYIFAVIVELFGIVLTSCGLAYELVSGADFGFIFITAGSVLIAFGGLLFAKVMPWVRGEKKR